MMCGNCEREIGYGEAEVGWHLEERCRKGDPEIVFRLADGTRLVIPAGMLSPEYSDG